MVNTSQIRILSVDDNRLFREGMAAVIDDQADMVLVAEAASGSEALQQFREHRPDVTLMDARLQNSSGMEVMAAIQAEFPGARVILVSTFTGDLDPQTALQAGAWAHIVKTMHPREIVGAIRHVNMGRKCEPVRAEPKTDEPVSEQGLTTREVELLAHAVGGKQSSDIGRRLLISEEMVRSNLEKIMQKLQARDYANALAIAARRGFIRL
jgi:DNA-binding NarL/FixJ family response regulator